MKNNFESKNRLLTLLSFVSLSYLSVYILLGFYTQPAVDDFSFANKLHNEGFINSQISWYTEWTGRYASTALITSYIKYNDLLKNYWQIPLALIFGTIIAFSILLYCIGNRKISVRQAACGGLLLSTVYLAGIPSTSETFYWLSGGITYQFGNILFILLIASVTHMLNNYSTFSAKRFGFFFSCILVVIVSGMNETIMFLEVLFLLILLVITKTEAKKSLLVLFLVSVASAAIVILAPGNQQRLSCFAYSHDLVLSVYNSFRSGFLDTSKWVLSLSMLLFTMIFISIISSYIKVIYPDYKVKRREIYFIVIGWLLIVCLYFPAFWSMGIAPPVRTYSVIYLMFMIWWLYSAYVLCSLLKASIEKIPYPFLMSITCMFVITLVFSGNGVIACRDLDKRERYLAEIQRRYEIIRNAKAQRKEQIFVPILQDVPWTIFVNDLSGDHADWKNGPYAEYFKVKTIATTSKYVD